MLICIHCHGPASWSKVLDMHVCPDCRCNEVEEDDEQETTQETLQ